MICMQSVALCEMSCSCSICHGFMPSGRDYHFGCAFDSFPYNIICVISVSLQLNPSKVMIIIEPTQIATMG